MRLKQLMKTKRPKYLVRPEDFHIFELDPSNGAYRSWSTRNVLYRDGTRPNADPHFTYEILTKSFDFFPIDESQLSEYTDKGYEYRNSLERGFHWGMQDDD
jgi:hypothetical protein